MSGRTDVSGVKFIDLKAQYPLIKDDILKKFDDIIENTAYVLGKYVREFEQAFAAYIGVKHCIALNNGTNALMLSLIANNVGYGDEIIMPVNTFIGTAEAASLIGAKPVFVDIDEATYNIDAAKIEEKITKKTKAIIPVHLYGQCADMNSIMKIAKSHNLIVIEDACQAHGAEYYGKKAGSIGAYAAFSAYPAKNLGTWGEGGMVTTDNDAIAERIRLMRDHGSRKKYYHEIVGGNFRINEFEAAVLSVKLKYLDAWNKKRRENANLYIKLMKDIEKIKLPSASDEMSHVWHLFVIRTKNRDKMMEHLKKFNIQTGIHYPFPLHLTDAYKYLGYKEGDFPIAEKVQKEIISLPMYPELAEDEIAYVAEKIREYFN